MCIEIAERNKETQINVNSILLDLLKFLPSSGARIGADSPAPLAPRHWRRLPTGAGNFTPLAAEFYRGPPELFTAGTTLIAARALVDGNPECAPVNFMNTWPLLGSTTVFANIVAM